MSARSISDNGSVHPLIRWLSLLWLVPKRALLRRRVRRTVMERVAGYSFVVSPQVFNPVIFRTGRFLGEFLMRSPEIEAMVRSGKNRALDVGTGCGVHGVLAAVRGMSVAAVDINPEAVRCARANALINRVEQRMEVLEGDLFAPVADRVFDLVICSLPKFRGEPQSGFDVGWRSPDVIERFAARLPGALTPEGMALVLLTSHGDDQGMLDALVAAGLEVRALEKRHFGVEIMTIYAVTRPGGVVSSQRG